MNTSMQSKDYDAVLEFAFKAAEQFQVDYGIERLRDHMEGGFYYSAKMLPARKNRQGWELRCEVVPWSFDESKRPATENYG